MGRSSAKFPWPQFLATWFLSGLILSAVHGPTTGTFLGLAIAVGYAAAVRLSPASHSYNTKRSRFGSVRRSPDL
jgi:hypothetical protein